MWTRPPRESDAPEGEAAPMPLGRPTSSRPIDIPGAGQGNRRNRSRGAVMAMSPTPPTRPVVRDTPPDHCPEHLPRRMLHWMPDSQASCQNCDRLFGMFRRRHHCRVCGRLLCHACCGHTARIPAVLHDQIPCAPARSWLTSAILADPDPTSDPARMCARCHDYVSQAARAERLVEVVVLCGADVRVWHRLVSVGGVWGDAGRLLLSVWRRIQYKHRWLGEELTPLQRDMVRNSAAAIYGHARWQRVASQLNLWPRPSEELVPCDTLLCFRYCAGARMGVSDCLEILLTCQHREARAHAVRALLEADASVLRCFVSVVLYLCAINTDLARNLLVPLVRRDERMAHEAYWRLRSGGRFCRDLQAHLLRSVSEEVRRRIEESEAWAQSFELAVSSDDPNYRETVMSAWSGREPCLPGRPDCLVVGTIIDELIVKDSSSCPVVVPILLRGAETTYRDPPERRHLLYKTDTPLLSDAVVIDSMRLLDLQILAERGRRLHRVLFHCQPLSETTGIVLLVPDSRTLYSISRGGDQSLLNYILSVQETHTVADVRRRFVESTAFSAVASLILGFGDRHNENILVSAREGCLFHIDFTYLFGREPGMKAPLVAGGPKLRLTNQMVDALGGQDSPDFESFKDLCTDLYKIAKRRAKDYYYLLYALVPANIASEPTVRAHLRHALRPGQSDDEAGLVVEERITHATTYRTVDTVLDTIHHWMKRGGGRGSSAAR